MDFSDFHKDVESIMKDATDPTSILLNGYTTFMMANKNNIEFIKNNRMHWFINNYLYKQSISTMINYQDYINYYKINIQDTYPYLYNPPSSYYTDSVPIPIPNTLCDSITSSSHTDDIDDHYLDYNNKYDRYVEFFNSQQKHLYNDNEELYDNQYDSLYDSSYDSDSYSDYESNEESYIEYNSDYFEEDYDY